MEIRPMRADEGERLREVARAAKGHWDYDAEQVRSWAAGLDYGGKDVWAAEEGGHVAAYGTLVVEGERAKLDELFLTGMIQHHKGALTMVAELRAAGGAHETNIGDFCNQVDNDQRMEIVRMYGLLGRPVEK